MIGKDCGRKYSQYLWQFKFNIYIYIFFFFEGEKNKSDNQLPSFWVGEKEERKEGFWHFLVAK